ncbi:MAG: glycine C-acetyltransferase [Deltaproteobacteria bacterium]|nr:glycine C-acetyltransferase [Deltaproteobacteria bacterium]
MSLSMEKECAKALAEITEAGLWKEERVLASPQGAEIRVGEHDVINFCANNYLGLANHPRLIVAAKVALDTRGYGMASVRFICGTMDLHKILEEKIARYLRREATILYASCFDANGGLFEAMLTDRDAVISDQLNHASIIDGIRLSKARRYRYRHAEMEDLEAKLRTARRDGARHSLIATDGVFSMDGDVAKLGEICQLAQRHDAAVMVDDSHATGFFGPGGRGTPAACGVEAQVDVITSTLGKALGGASGGFTTGRQSLIDLLRNRSRPYLFSNSLPPVVAAASIAALDLLGEVEGLRERLTANTRQFRAAITAAGFDVRPGDHPIVPIMLGDAALAGAMAKALLQRGIYVIGFSYPVVPHGVARIRVQLSAAHTPAHIERAVEAFTDVGRALHVI